MDRQQVMAYRIAAQGLHRETADPHDLAVFDLGVQDNQRGGPAIALAARLSTPADPGDDRFALLWSHRGAPHLHRRQDRKTLVAGLVPLSETDAQARMNWQRAQVARAGVAAAEALAVTAKALRKAVGKTMTKGAASTAVTKLVPDGFSVWCRGCGATHILEQLMRLAAPLAGLELVRDASPATLTPMENRGPVPAKPDVAAATAVMAAYLRLHGPATPGDAGGFSGTTATVAKDMWPSDLAEVQVDGKKRYLPADALALLENPPEPDVVRLLPPSDPLLQARDRDLLVPEKPHQKEIWKILGNPGALLADGEIAGVWRPKTSGKRLSIAVTSFWPLDPGTQNRVGEEAELVAAARGLTLAKVDW
ncbi:DNA glycosylase AlkZ-like family protein [Amycolatopsis magusensis]|uniref:DNA glycosylase AlkZ-like family protein n=1 Tax=Amycolatopsis magusensis TaxID=882444 RepID=UPI003C2B9E61